MNTYTELLTVLLECNRDDLNDFCDMLIAHSMTAEAVVSAARKMGLEPLTLSSLLEAMNKLKEEGK